MAPLCSEKLQARLPSLESIISVRLLERRSIGIATVCFMGSLIVGSTAGIATSASFEDCKVPSLFFLVEKCSERDGVHTPEKRINNIVWTFTPPNKQLHTCETYRYSINENYIPSRTWRKQLNADVQMFIVINPIRLPTANLNLKTGRWSFKDRKTQPYVKLK